MNRRGRHSVYLRFAAAVLLLAVFLFPIYWLFMIAFKTPEEIFSSPPAWYPAAIQFDNFRVLFKDGDAKTVFNSLFIAGTSTLLAMFLGTIAAYSLARFRTGGESRNGPRELDSAVSGIFLGFQAAKSR